MKTNELLKLLTTVGLTTTEAGVYTDLLQYGTQTISSISRTSKLHRPAIYKALPSLLEKGLISQRQIGKLTHYAAEPPERLQTLLTAVHEQLDNVVPELTMMRDRHKPVVRRLDGIVGVHAVFDDIIATLPRGGEFYRISSVRHSDQEQVGLPKGYEARRDEKRLERLVISNDDYVKSREPKLEESLQVVPDDFLPFDYDVAQVIYGNKIAFIDYTYPLATIIEHELLAKFQTDVFKMLFRALRNEQRRR
jgi:predicted transcriptional regulator